MRKLTFPVIILLFGATNNLTAIDENEEVSPDDLSCCLICKRTLCGYCGFHNSTIQRTRMAALNKHTPSTFIKKGNLHNQTVIQTAKMISLYNRVFEPDAAGTQRYELITNFPPVCQHFNKEYKQRGFM